MRTLEAVVTLVVLTTSCGPRVTPNRVTGDTENRIALCTAGFTRTARREIAAEISRQGGELIRTDEVETRGVDTFAFGEQRGQAAIDIYNAYVGCLNQEAGASADLSSDMLVPQPMLHEIGVTRSGEPVVQTPPPGQERVGEDIQLQIVLGANKTSWDSSGTPRWRGWCSSSLSDLGPGFIMGLVELRG